MLFKNVFMEYTYFNFPINLLNGFLDNPDGRYTNPKKTCLDNIIEYAVYKKSLEYGLTQSQNRIEACEYLCVNDIGVNSYNNGKKLFNQINSKVMVGIESERLFDYYKNDKTEFEKVCLLAHLGLKSIIGSSIYKKVTFNYMLSRMSGETKTLKDLNDLHPVIQKYNTTRKRTKIIKDLQDSWHLNYYSNHVRGFYVSYKMSLMNLIIKVEYMKQTKAEKRKEDIKEGKRLALERFNKDKAIKLKAKNNVHL